MTEYLVNEIDLSNVATAIRQKTGGENLISFPDEYISGIESLTNASYSESVNGGGGLTATITM